MDDIKKIKIDVDMFIPKSDEWVDRYEREIEEQRMAVERQKKLEYYRSSSSGVPPLFYKESFDTYVTENKQDELNLEVVKSFSKALNTNKVLLITGKVGNGKSHLGASIIREASGLMVTAEDLEIEYSSSMNFSSKHSSEDILEKYSSTNMLVIDEFGRSMKADKEAELIGYILRKRYSNVVPTCLISNLSKEQIVKRLGGAVFDRLKETCTAIKFDKPSYRKRIAEDNYDIKTRL